MINNFLKAVGATPESSSTTSKPSTPATSVTDSAATAAATALDVGENLAHTIGGWLNLQEGKSGDLKVNGGSVAGRYYYEERLVRFFIRVGWQSAYDAMYWPFVILWLTWFRLFINKKLVVTNSQEANQRIQN